MAELGCEPRPFDFQSLGSQLQNCDSSNQPPGGEEVGKTFNGAQEGLRCRGDTGVWWSPSLRGSTVTTALLGRLKSVLEKTVAHQQLALPGNSGLRGIQGRGGGGGGDGATENPLRRPLFHPRQACQLRLLSAAMQRPQGASEWVSVRQSLGRDALGLMPPQASRLQRPCQPPWLQLTSGWGRGVPKGTPRGGAGIQKWERGQTCQRPAQERGGGRGAAPALSTDSQPPRESFPDTLCFGSS